VAADVHHQLQRRIPVFGCFASRTSLVVHFCVCNTKYKLGEQCQQLAALLSCHFPGGELLCYTECGPTGNAINKISSCIIMTSTAVVSTLWGRYTQGSMAGHGGSEVKKSGVVYFHVSTYKSYLERMYNMSVLIIGFTFVIPRLPTCKTGLIHNSNKISPDVTHYGLLVLVG